LPVVAGVVVDDVSPVELLLVDSILDSPCHETRLAAGVATAKSHNVAGKSLWGRRESHWAGVVTRSRQTAPAISITSMRLHVDGFFSPI